MEAINELVQLGGDKDVKDANGRTALHAAASNGHVEAINVLVQLGLDKEAKDAGGGTPLHYAAVEGHVEAINVLVQLGACKYGCTDCQWRNAAPARPVFDTVSIRRRSC